MGRITVFINPPADAFVIKTIQDKIPAGYADDTVTVSLDNRLNPEYLLPFFSFGTDTSMISFSGTLFVSTSGIAARYRFVIALLISTYRYKFAMLFPIGTHSFVWTIFPSCTFSFVLRILKKHIIFKAVLVLLKAVKHTLLSMELHLDASIDKLDNLAMNVQIDKENHVENTKSEEQKVPNSIAEPERVDAEIVYAPMVAEAHEYQYNADAFEARGGVDVKMETAKEVSKVREDKAR